MLSGWIRSYISIALTLLLNYVYGLYFAVSHINIGKKLLKHCASIANEEHAARFQWQVLDWNEPARQFYRKIGAKVSKCSLGSCSTSQVATFSIPSYIIFTTPICLSICSTIVTMWYAYSYDEYFLHIRSSLSGGSVEWIEKLTLIFSPVISDYQCIITF